MQRILVHIDGVLVDIYTRYAAYEFKETGCVVDLRTIAGAVEVVAFPIGHK